MQEPLYPQAEKSFHFTRGSEDHQEAAQMSEHVTTPF